MGGSAMSAQSRSRVRDWLLRQALPQEDGTYLVRPFRWFPPLVYQVDEPTRDRLVTVQLWFGRVGLSFVILALLFADGFRGWTRWTIIVGILVVGYGSPLLVLRHAPRVPRSRWSGPAIVAPEARFPRWLYLAFFVLSIVLLLVIGNAVRRTLQQPGAVFPPEVGLGVLLLALCAWRFWTLYRRGKSKTD